VPSEGFLERVHAGVRLFPDACLTFYSNWSSQNGAAVRLAAAAGATWVEDNGVEYFPTLAQVMPASCIDDYVDIATPLAQLWLDDDDAMREFLTSRGVRAYLSVPCLVEHATLRSLIGNDSQGARLAACFDAAPVHDGSYEALAHSIDYVPWLKAGRVLSMVRTAIAGKHEYLRRPWTALAEPLGLDAGELRNAYDAFVARSPRLQKASYDLGDMFTYSLWLTSCLMGTVLRRNKVPVRVLSGSAATRLADPIARAGLSTLAPGAIRWTLLPAQLLDSYSAETTDLTEAGFTCGMTGD
jgi:hypothetical protein